MLCKAPFSAWIPVKQQTVLANWSRTKASSSAAERKKPGESVMGADCCGRTQRDGGCQQESRSRRSWNRLCLNCCVGLSGGGGGVAGAGPGEDRKWISECTVWCFTLPPVPRSQLNFSQKCLVLLSKSDLNCFQ